MTNLEIIASEVITRELLTKEQVNEMLEKFGMLPYMTYQEWKYKWYQVKKGSKAIIKTKLWKKVRNRKKDEDNEEESKFIMVSASLFDSSQVEKIEKVAQA